MTQTSKSLAIVSPESNTPRALDTLKQRQADDLADLFGRHALAANTRRAYEQGWRDFVEFCRMHRYKPLPATQSVIAAYLNWLSGTVDAATGLQRDEGLKFATISLRQHAIAYVHDIKHLSVEGYQNPARSKLVTTTVSAIKRKLEDSAANARDRRRDNETSVRHERDLLSTQVRALLLDDMQKLVAALPPTLSGERDRALLLTGYAGAFRRSELVAITFRDLTWHDDGVTIRVRRSKTDQKGVGEDKFIAELPDDLAQVCPVNALKIWIATLHEHEMRGGYIFRRVFKNKRIGKEGLSDKAVEIIVRRAISDADLPHPVAAYAGHSLRAGFVTQALENGADPISIIEVTKHKNIQMVQRYVRPTAARRKKTSMAGFVATDRSYTQKQKKATD
jgi:site-specific recombinase XerD